MKARFHLPLVLLLICILVFLRGTNAQVSSTFSVIIPAEVLSVEDGCSLKVRIIDEKERILDGKRYLVRDKELSHFGANKKIRLLHTDCKNLADSKKRQARRSLENLVGRKRINLLLNDLTVLKKNVVPALAETLPDMLDIGCEQLSSGVALYRSESRSLTNPEISDRLSACNDKGKLR